MHSARVFINLILTLSLFTPFAGGGLVAQVSNGYTIAKFDFVEYNKLKLRSVDKLTGSNSSSSPSELVFSPLTAVEKKLAQNLKSHWIWSENTLDIIDSYSTFLFRTRKSAKIDEVKVLVQINSMGRLSAFEVLTEVDKGLQERIDYVLRQLPDCKPVPGFQKYGLEYFEIVIKK